MEHGSLLVGAPPRLSYSAAYTITDFEPTNVIVYRIEEEEFNLGTGTPVQPAYYGVPIVGGQDATGMGWGSPPGTPLESIPKDLLDRLNYLTTLPENWYVQGSHQISSRAIDKAVELLLWIQRITKGGLPPPFIAPSPDGGLALRWKTSNGTELHLEIPPNGTTTEYLFVRTVSGRDVEELEGQLDETNVVLSSLLGRL